MTDSEQTNIQFLKNKIEELRNRLNQLTAKSQSTSFDKEIILLSQYLDEFICAYHRIKKSGLLSDKGEYKK